MNELFSDHFAQRKNYLTEVDARIKMIFVAAAIITAVLSQRFYVPAVVFFLSMAFLLTIRIPARIILLRLAAPSGMAGAIFLLQFFFYGTRPIIKLDLLGACLIGYEEGLARGFLIMAKVLGAVSLVMFLSMTTPVNKLFNAARWFKVPDTWVEIAMFSYRYIFVLLEDAITVRDAQEARLGYSGLARSLRSFGALMGSTVIRAYDHSVAASEAMMSRGYNGSSRNIVREEKFGARDTLAAVASIIVLVFLAALNILIR